METTKDEVIQSQGVTIRDVIPLMDKGCKVFIKPYGRDFYFSGIADDIPCYLMKCIIREINSTPYINNDPAAIYRHGSELGFWIDAIDVPNPDNI